MENKSKSAQSGRVNENGSRRVTQAELARELNLTQETVSHALRGTGTLAEATRERVKALAAKRGYRPHAVARSMQKGSFDSIGLLSSTSGRAWPIQPSTLRGIFEVLHDNGINMVFARLPDVKFLGEKGAPRILTELMVDALILNLGPDTAKPAIELVEASHIPAILINKKQSRNCVYPDEKAAIRQAMERLISLGHQRIGYLERAFPAGETRHFSSEDRELGYLEAIKDTGLPPLLIKPAQSGAALLRVCIRDALLGQNSHQGVPVTAFITGNRGQAEILLLEAIRLGLEPGRDFSLIAVDMVTDPVGDTQIDFLRTPAYWLGRAASQLALDLLKSGKATLPSRLVPYHDYIEGQTCGPAPLP